MMVSSLQPSFAQNFEEGSYLGGVTSFHGLPIDSLWQYHPGDENTWTNPPPDNRPWPTVNTEYLRDKAGRALPWPGIGWFHQRFSVPVAFRGKPIALRIGHFGASEIYLDGKPVGHYGKVGKTLSEESIYVPRIPLILQLDGQASHRLTVRYSNHRANLPTYGNEFRGFRLVLSPPGQAILHVNNNFPLLPMMFSINLAFCLFFWLVYFSYPARLASLLSALSLVNFSLLFIALRLVLTLSEGELLVQAAYLRNLAIGLVQSWWLLFGYAAYYGKWPGLAGGGMDGRGHLTGDLALSGIGCSSTDQSATHFGAFPALHPGYPERKEWILDSLAGYSIRANLSAVHYNGYIQLVSS